MSKKPDNIVFSEEEGYNAKLLPYATTVGAPIIKLDDVVTWKAQGIHRVNKEFQNKFDELKNEYNRLIEEYQWNDMIYNAKFTFEPVVGEIYYMYLDKYGKEFLSLISPTEWKQEFIGTFKLNSERKWILLDKNEQKSTDI
jgi:UDP-N-acetylglucosamine 2-epimerase